MAKYWEEQYYSLSQDLYIMRMRVTYHQAEHRGDYQEMRRADATLRNDSGTVWEYKTSPNTIIAVFAECNIRLGEGCGNFMK